MAKKPKVVLIPAKDARALVEKQGLEINRLQNELKSMTGARDNCKTMHEFNANLVNEKNQEIVFLERSIKNQRLILEVRKGFHVREREELLAFQDETAVSLIKRGIGKLVLPIRNAVVNLVARIKFK